MTAPDLRAKAREQAEKFMRDAQTWPLDMSWTAQIDALASLLLSVAEEARREALEAAIAMAEAEPELPGASPAEFQFSAAQDEIMRVAVRVTKQNIATAIRALVAAPREGKP